jgi:hypothetical protein
MRVICCRAEFPVPENTLRQSSLLSELHCIDPEGCAGLPCGPNTWLAWAAGDPAGIREVELLHNVIEVSFLYVHRAGYGVPLVALHRHKLPVQSFAHMCAIEIRKLPKRRSALLQCAKSHTQNLKLERGASI